MAPATPEIVAVAMGAHVVLSMIYGVILALIALGIPALRSSVVTLTLIGMLYGLALWLVNFYLIAPAALPWFADASPIQQFIAHAIFFGAPLGWYLGTKLAPAEELV